MRDRRRHALLRNQLATKKTVWGQGIQCGKERNLVELLFDGKIGRGDAVARASMQ